MKKYYVGKEEVTALETECFFMSAFIGPKQHEPEKAIRQLWLLEGTGQAKWEGSEGRKQKLHENGSVKVTE